MNGIRRALLLTTSERYFTLAVNFMMLAIVSRLLTPGELGISILGSAVGTLACALREFVTPAYLIQLKNLGEHDVRTSVTLQFLISGSVGFVLIVASNLIASIYGEPRLAAFIQVVGLAIVIECVQIHIGTLLRRNMAFERLALINISNATVAAFMTILLAWLGYSYMSFAWAWVICATLTALLSVALWGELSVFRPSLKAWRGVLHFGGYNGVAVLTGRLCDALPYLVLGRLLPLEAVALYNRSLTVCQIPDKALLGGVAPVMMPALSAHKRDGGDVGRACLRALYFITGLQWPALAGLCLLAHPIVQLLLGEQWLAIVPLVQIISIAFMLTFMNELTYPLLVSVGAGRDLFIRALIIWPISAAIIVLAASYGLRALAWSWFLSALFQSVVSIAFVRRHVHLPWTQVLSALGRSLIVTLISMIGPIVIIVANGSGFQIGLDVAAMAIALAAIGWFGGLCLTQHPLLEELKTIVWKLLSRPPPQAEPGR